MTTNKYTTGPWKVVENGNEIYVGDKYQNAIQLQLQANARLIAQAPAMYDLLKRIANDPNLDDEEALRLINQVINDVEGGK